MTHSKYKVLLAEVSQDLDEPACDITSDILKAWEPTYRPLSEEEISMKCISHEVNKFLVFIYSNTLWRGAESEMTLKTCSSVVCLHKSNICVLKNTELQGNYVVAVTQHFFDHTFGNKQGTFAYVNVFDNLKQDCSSQLHCVSTDHYKVGIARANALPSPLVSAIDEDKKSSMWILNLKPTCDNV